MSDIIFSFVFALVIASNPATPSDTCQKFFVTTKDGYVNIRSSSQVKTGNILATLPSGSSVQISQHRQRWLKINFPLSGWLIRNQISRISCDAGRDLLMNLGLPTMTKLGKKSQLGDEKAAEILVKMSPYLDGVSEEVYAGVIAEWANQNPNFLVSILNRENLSIRQSVLSSLDFGLGVINSPERQNFETFLQHLSPQNPTLRDWHQRIPVYPTDTLPNKR
ncbi:hypothetical protein [Nostoc sp. ATCC 53789]|uniref:hypothetical protein n=1 Tax=Nostoc sp. ATCC 53789 TaxID=76335 RepID=UPI001C68A8D8|nr:hypothetical protein [Nostoc sp. ATCC 53789]